MHSVVVIQTSFLGDTVLTTPLLELLAQRAQVTVVTTPASAALLRGHPAVARVVPYDKRGADGGLGGLRRCAASVRAQAASDVAFLAQGSHRSGALARLAGYAKRVGFASAPGRIWYTDRVSPPPGAHHAQRLLALAGIDEASAVAPKPTLYPAAAEVGEVNRLVDGLDARPLIALAPGSVWATKRWPGFPALARELATLGRIVVLGGELDRGLAAEIRGATGHDTLDTTGQLSLLASAELIRRSAVLVTNDSLPLHLASAMDTPTVALFGPTVEAFGFGPLATQRSSLGVAGLPCRPCHAHGPARCPLEHFRCMRDLTVSDVAEAVRRMLGA